MQKLKKNLYQKTTLLALLILHCQGASIPPSHTSLSPSTQFRPRHTSWTHRSSWGDLHRCGSRVCRRRRGAGLVTCSGGQCSRGRGGRTSVWSELGELAATWLVDRSCAAPPCRPAAATAAHLPSYPNNGLSNSGCSHRQMLSSIVFVFLNWGKWIYSDENWVSEISEKERWSIYSYILRTMKIKWLAGDFFL